MQKIIVTADDYGMCDIVDKAIDKGIENGFITTTNVMLNMESLSNAKTLRERYPHISIGIHWNVTTGKPLCNPKDIPTLVDENGEFWSIREFKKRYSKKLIKEKDLEKELERQYKLFEDTCGHPDYWNTHENSALHLKAFKVFAKVAKKHKIIATRTFQRVYYDKINIGFKREIREFIVSKIINVWFKKIRKSFKMPTARVICFGKISKTQDNNLLNTILKDGRNNIEIVFHPALFSESPYFGNISTERVKEYEYLSSKIIYNKYIHCNIEFVNFNEL